MNNIVKLILFFPIVFLPSFTKGQTTLKYSLEDCIRYAENNNTAILSAQYDRLASELQLKKKKEQIAPSITASATQDLGYSHDNVNGGTSWGGHYSLNAEMNLFKGLNTLNNIKQSKIELEKSDLTLEQIKNQHKIKIINAYLSILMNRELLKNQEQLLSTSEAQLREGEAKYKAGKILESDYTLLDAQYKSDLGNVAITNINIQNNLLTLKILLSIDTRVELDIITPDSSSLSLYLSIPSMEEVISEALIYLPELKIMEKERETALYDVKIAKSNYYPSLSLNAKVATGYANGEGSFGNQIGTKLGESISLNLNIPIYDRSYARYQVKQADIRLKQIELDNVQSELNIMQDIEQSYLELNKSYNNYMVSEAMKNAYEVTYRVYYEKFKHGAITTVDLLQQQTNYLNKYLQYLQDKYTFVLNRKIIDVYMGKAITL